MRHAAARLTCVLVVVIACAISMGQAPSRPARLIAIFIVDGLRPDSVNGVDTPTIARLRSEGVDYINSHSVFPTATRVNTTALATGAYPAWNGIVGNSMFVAGVNPLAAFDTSDYRQLLKLEEVAGRAVTVETLGEVLQQNGRKLVTLSSGSTGNGFLLNPRARNGAGVAIHGLFERGVTTAYPKEVSDVVIQRFGAPPPDDDDIGQMHWTDTVLQDYVLPELRPDVIIDWMGPLDAAQHAQGVGSPQAKRALAQIDESIQRTIAKIDALGLLPRTDIVVASDHGFARNDRGVDITGALISGGLKAAERSTDVIMANQGPSTLFYLATRSTERIEKLVRFLQAQPWVDVIFTRGGANGRGSVDGTFSLDLIKGNHPSRAADVVVSHSWNSQPNAYGVPGGNTVPRATTGLLQGEGSGHGGLSPWDIHNTFVAWGASFKQRTQIGAPVSLADVAPTVLTLLGLKPPVSSQGRGRVLQELLKDGPAVTALRVTRRTLTTNAGTYRASVEISTVDRHDYIDSASRQE
ncbi:MAG: sulfatase-like hydrolase/transferase [Acidobacteria bacterium]|nr:sulfatase-like hydrolase/transferase [Acidobacteriota bacterium]